MFTVIILRLHKFQLTPVDFMLQDIFATMQGSQLSATRVQVSNMQGVTNVFDIAGAGTMASIENVTISRVDLSGTGGTPPPVWTGVNVRDMAMAQVNDLIASNSNNVRHLVSAQMSSMLSVDDVVATNMIGGRQRVSTASV